MENPARNDCMLHNQELKSKGENHNGGSRISTTQLPNEKEGADVSPSS
jgi:hypothetical protein